MVLQQQLPQQRRNQNLKTLSHALTAAFENLQPSWYQLLGSPPPPISNLCEPRMTAYCPTPVQPCPPGAGGAVVGWSRSILMRRSVRALGASLVNLRQSAIATRRQHQLAMSALVSLHLPLRHAVERQRPFPLWNSTITAACSFDKRRDPVSYLHNGRRTLSSKRNHRCC